jgi:undecaprenyl-diphosphatase
LRPEAVLKIMDSEIFFWINSHHNVFLDHLFRAVSAAGELYLFWWAAGLVSFLADKKRGWSVLLGVIFSLLFVFVSVDLVMKPAIARLRPFEAMEGVRCFGRIMTQCVSVGSASFPSGHCASAAGAAVVLCVYYPRLRAALALLVGLTAYSRVYLGMHYPTDCAAGLAVGVLCGFAGLFLSAWAEDLWHARG